MAHQCDFECGVWLAAEHMFTACAARLAHSACRTHSLAPPHPPLSAHAPPTPRKAHTAARCGPQTEQEQKETPRKASHPRVAHVAHGPAAPSQTMGLISSHLISV